MIVFKIYSILSHASRFENPGVTHGSIIRKRNDKVYSSLTPFFKGLGK